MEIRCDGEGVTDGCLGGSRSGEMPISCTTITGPCTAARSERVAEVGDETPFVEAAVGNAGDSDRRSGFAKCALAPEASPASDVLLPESRNDATGGLCVEADPFEIATASAGVGVETDGMLEEGMRLRRDVLDDRAGSLMAASTAQAFLERLEASGALCPTTSNGGSDSLTETNGSRPERRDAADLLDVPAGRMVD